MSRWSGSGILRRWRWWVHDERVRRERDGGGKERERELRLKEPLLKVITYIP